MPIKFVVMTAVEPMPTSITKHRQISIRKTTKSNENIITDPDFLDPGYLRYYLTTIMRNAMHQT